MKQNKTLAILLMSFLALPIQSLANTSTTIEQLDQSRITYDKKQALLQSPKVTTFSIAKNSVGPANNKPIQGNAQFTLQSIRLEGDSEAFPFLIPIIKTYERSPVTMESINILVNKLNNALIQRGYVTSQVTIPEQNIKAGTLRLYVMAGRIDTVQINEPYQNYQWKNSFPMREGDILNLHQLEQGLEQVKTMQTADMTMKLLPSSKVGYSVVSLLLKESKREYGLITIDDSGLPETGKWQTAATISVDRFFQDTDTLSLHINQDTFNGGKHRGSKGTSITYTFPRGWHTFSFNYSQNSFKQWIPAKPEPFISSGHSNSISGTWKTTLYRNQHSILTASTTLKKKISRNYINDTELALQAKDFTTLETGLSYKRTTENDTLVASVTYKRSLSWFGAMTDYGEKDLPSARYAMVVYDLDYKHPFTWNHNKIKTVYTASLHGQHTFGHKMLYGSDMIAIGGRYTVRGFDSNYSLQGESGGYFRQELAFPFEKIPVQAFIGFDIGHVYGPSTEYSLGKTLLGGVIGCRGQLGKYSQFEVSIGSPLRYPEGFRTSSVTTTCSFSIRF